MSNEMMPSLTPATQDDQQTIQNMARFYVYEMSRYCGGLPGWEMPNDGLYDLSFPAVLTTTM